MHVKNLHWAFLGLLFTASAFAQKSTIEGNADNVGGQSLKNVQVRIQQENARSQAVTVKTDAKGHFVAADLPAGRYTVAVIVGGAAKWSAAHVKAASGQVVRLNLGGKQVATTATAAQRKKRAVWVPAQTGSHMGGHWEDEADRGPDVGNVEGMGSEALRRYQNIPNTPSATGGR